MTVDLYLHQGKQFFARWAGNGRVRAAARVLGCTAVGFVFSAGGLERYALPFAMGLVSAMTGWRAAAMGVGSICGYLFFWGPGGNQAALWTALAAVTALTVGKRVIVREVPLLIPALCALWVAVAGLGFQLLYRNTPTLVYLLRVVLAWGSAQLFTALKRKREPLLLWCAEAMAVLALARIAPVTWLNFGCIAAGILGAGEAFPGAILAGLALDLLRISPVSVTAVMAGACVVRLIPGLPGWLCRLAPAGICLLAASLSGGKGLVLLPGLVLGGMLSVWMPQRMLPSRRRGETDLIQVRLELMAEVLTQTRNLLMEVADPPVDEESLLIRTRERACGGCPNRRTCGGPDRIPREVLRKPMTENTSLPFFCRKPGRMVLEIRRSQEQYRVLKAERQRRRECRNAVSQQYLFLSEFLREQALELPRRGRRFSLQFQPEVGFAARGREAENGDQFRHFSGPGGQYFLLLCDGMGTGSGAAEEGGSAAALLQGMLTAGFPPEHALESLNSLLALRGRAGAVTVDLAQIRLDTGAAVLYKWGAAPSLLFRSGRAEKIGTAGPPPGIRGADDRERQTRLSLRRGEMLIILSDGVDGEGVCRRAVTEADTPAGELAARLLDAGAEGTADDATLAVVRLYRPGMLT